MLDEALANAFAELHSLQDRRVEIDAKIATLNDDKAKLGDRIMRAAEFIVAWHEFAGAPVPTVEAVLSAYRTPGTILDTPVALKVTGNPKKEAVAAATSELIRERNRPIVRHELYDLLKERGIEVRGADPLVTLSTMLWRAGPSKGLIHLKGHGYWDATQPYVPASYIPGNLVATGKEDLTMARSEGPLPQDD
jgi:hypothetical protein